MVWEVDAISAKPNSTSGYEGERLATIHSANCGALDWYDARDSGRVVRTYQEMDVGPVSLSSTTGCEGEWSAFDPLPKLTQASDKDVRIIVGKERESYEPELN